MWCKAIERILIVQARSLIGLSDTIVFVVCDIISLVVQSVGGATASIATENDRNPNSVRVLPHYVAV